MEKCDNLVARMTDTHTHIVTMATVNVHAETDRHTHTHTDILITILYHCSRGRSNEILTAEIYKYSVTQQGQ